MLTLRDLGLGFAVPALAAAIIVLVLRTKQLRSNTTERYAASLAIFVGFFLGYRLIPLGPWMPDVDWHWIPYAVVGAAIVGSATLADGISRVDQTLLTLFAAAALACAIVPTFDDLAPTYPYQFAALVTCVLLFSLLFEPISERLPGPTTPAILIATGLVAAAILLLSGSLGFMQIAFALVGSLCGVIAVAFLQREVNALRGAAPLLASLLCGLLLVGRAYSFSSVPTLSYLLVPLAPLTLGLVAFGPVGRLSPRWKLTLQIALPLIVLASALLLGIVAEYGGTDEY